MIFEKGRGVAGLPALQWVYSMLAFCRGQGKRRAPAVQTLVGVVDLVDILQDWFGLGQGPRLNQKQDKFHLLMPFKMFTWG